MCHWRRVEMWRWEPHQCCKSRGVLQLHVSYFSYFFLFQCHWWLLLSYSNQRVELCKSFFMNGKAALININHHILVFSNLIGGIQIWGGSKCHTCLFVCLFQGQDRTFAWQIKSNLQSSLGVLMRHKAIEMVCTHVSLSHEPPPHCWD